MQYYAYNSIFTLLHTGKMHEVCIMEGDEIGDSFPVVEWIISIQSKPRFNPTLNINIPISVNFDRCGSPDASPVGWTPRCLHYSKSMANFRLQQLCDLRNWNCDFFQISIGARFY